MFSNYSGISVAFTHLQNGDEIAGHPAVVSLLSAEEQATYFGKSNALNRLQFLTGRVLARHLYASLLPGQTGVLKTDALGKPFFDDQPQWGVSIAHSGQMVVCAINTGGSVGIDAEMIRPVNFTAFEACFRPGEWAFIQQHTNPLSAFFTLWTKKEAVAKADGRGLGMDFREIDALSDVINSWATMPLELGAGYVAALAYTPATDSPILTTAKIRLDDLLVCAAESTKFTR